jgi:hypothetical protein
MKILYLEMKDSSYVDPPPYHTPPNSLDYVDYSSSPVLLLQELFRHESDFLAHL